MLVMKRVQLLLIEFPQQYRGAFSDVRVVGFELNWPAPGSVDSRLS
jgi:hypothetical protein